MKTYTLKHDICVAAVTGDSVTFGYETITAVVTGDLTFRSDGTVSYVWSCQNIDWYREGKFIASSYGPISASRAKRKLDEYVLVKA